MVALIVLNIILIIIVIFLVMYLLRNKKDDVKNVCKNNNEYKEDNNEVKIKKGKHKRKNKIKTGREFVGRFVSDDEYQQMSKNKNNDISNLLKIIDIEYEHLKELNK